ncbi:MAG: NAD(P)/FAD-dependent oxidoreductase [Thiovulaceae bacterium]|nr:NAD(P)/FAD-dependent oxidoreductase [Sulfurimonadaceae bacterium]
MITSAELQKAEVCETGVRLLVGGESITCETVLCAVGRTPYTQGLRLENAGVACSEKGFIEVDPSFRSAQKHIYAVGDCIDTLAYAHTAYAEARITAQNIIGGGSALNSHVTPSTIFTDPAVASCGLREKEAGEQGRAVEVRKAYFKANAKAKIEGDDSGFAKIIVCSESGVILGASVVGVEATEIIHEMVLAVEKRLTATELKEMIHAHPSVSEIFRYI